MKLICESKIIRFREIRLIFFFKKCDTAKQACYSSNPIIVDISKRFYKLTS